MKILLIIISVVLSLVSTCAKKSEDIRKKHSVINVDSANEQGINSLIELALSKSVELEFASNPSTGYCWAWVNKPDVAIVDTIDWVYRRNAEPLIGGGGNELWTFKGIQTGVDTIEMIYRQEWAPEMYPIEVKIIFNVKE